MAPQTTKKTLLSSRSFLLDTVDRARFLDATLSGNGLSAAAHQTLSGISSVFRGDTLTARGNNNTLTGGAGNDFLVAFGANNLLVASAGSDTLVSKTSGSIFQVANLSQLTATSIAGGKALDTLQILGGLNLSDAGFARMTGVDIVSLAPEAGPSSVTLGALAERAGIKALYGSNSGLTVRQEIRQTRAMTIIGGSGDDLFSFASSAQVGANSIDGGLGLDTLRVDTGTMADPIFRKISGMEVLSLGSGSSATLGNTASAKGLQTVVAGSSNVTVQAASMVAPLTIDASAVAGRVFLSGSSGGSLFLLRDRDALDTSTLRGAGGVDTLSMSRGAGSYTDSLFARMRGIEVMGLAGGNNSVELGRSAALSGMITLISGSAGGDTINQTAGGYYLDASAAQTGVTFNVASPTLLAGSDASRATTILGGSGIDTLVIGAGDYTDTSFFKNITGVEAISFAGLTSGGAITLDGGLAGSVDTIVGSSGPMTFTQTEGSFVIDGRAGESNVFDLLADGSLLADDTILGGSGVDSLFLGEASLEDDAFKNISSVEFLSLGGSASLILGAAASSAGIATLLGGEGDNTIGVTAGSYYLDASGASSNLFSLSDSSLLSASTIIGNGDADTLSVESGSLDDTDFVNLSGVPVLYLSSDASVQFGALASDAGIATLYGGEGDVSVELLTGGLDIEAGDATGTFLVKGVESGVMAASTFTGNGEGSTIAFSEGEVSDDAFANVKDVGSIILEGSSTITLEDAAASAGIGSVIGGSGDTTFIQTAGSYVLDGSGGTSNLFALSGAALAASNTIIGAGAGADTLTITEEDSFNDSLFANITGINLLSLSGSSSVTLGSAAAESGVVELIMGDGDSRILLDSDAPSILLDGEGSSSLFVGITDAALAATSTLYGGEGTDTLAFGNGNVIDDEAFSNVQGFEVVSVTGGSSVILGAAAVTGGLDSIYGGAGINTITQTAENANALYINGGSGQLRAELDNIYYLVNDTILGGTSTLGNTLSVNGDGNIFDSYFTNQARLQTLLLAGNNSVELGSEAARAGVSRVNVKDGDNSFTVSANGPVGVTLDASAGKGDNSFAFNSAAQLVTTALSPGARIYGADGTDTLSIETSSSIADTLFARADSIEVLQLSGASAVTLGTYADSTGIETVIGGSGGTTFTQDSLSTSSYYLNGSADTENGNKFVMANAAQVAGNTLFGGDVLDTLWVGSGVVAGDAFANISSVELLRLNDSGSVILGSYADQSGLMSVVGGGGSNTFSHDATSKYFYYLDGHGGSHNLFVAGDAALAALDTYVGGAGTDTLRIAGDRIEDYHFSNHSSIEVLQLIGTSDVTLASAAATSGIRSIYSDSGATSIDASAMTGSLVIDASAGSGASFLLAGSGADTITGGSGADTLQGWATSGNSASDTIYGGVGSDLFILGDATGNAYGTGGSKALISDFSGGTDYLQLRDYGSGASSYRVDANAGVGYTHQLFDTHTGSNVLLANINYSGSNATGDLLGTKALFA